MPVLFRGLEALIAGVSSGTQQMTERNAASMQQFIDTNTAIGEGIRQNDDLEFRRLYATDAAGTPVQQRFDTAINDTTNPYVGIQALLAQQAAAQPLAMRAGQDQNFALRQGIPQGFEEQLQDRWYGVNTLLQDRANRQQIDLLGQAPSLNNNTFTDAYNAPGVLGAVTSANAMAIDMATREAQSRSDFQRYQSDSEAEKEALRREIANLKQMLMTQQPKLNLPADQRINKNQDGVKKTAAPRPGVTG